MPIGSPSRFKFSRLAIAAAALTALSGAAAAQYYSAPWSPGSSMSLAMPGGGAVARFYERQQNRPIWFRPGAGAAATNELMRILHNAPVDGLASGPQLAIRAQQAIRLAQSGNP